MALHRAGHHERPDFRGLLLLLRGRAGLSQRELATRLGVSERAVQTWEAGTSYPSAEPLKSLIALYVTHGGFSPGQVAEEAQALWDTARDESSRLLPPFDDRWFATLPTSAPSPERLAPDAALHQGAPASTATTLRVERQDWGEAPDTSALYGRQREEADVTRWILADGGRLVVIQGMGGIGKTALAAHLARSLALQFEAVYWRSLRNAPPSAEWLAGAISFLSAHQQLPADGEDARIRQFLELLRAQRCLLILDNLETVLAPGAAALRYRESYAGYGQILQSIAETTHGSCLLVTSREQPPELERILAVGAKVQVLPLGGVDLPASRAMLAPKELAGDDAAWQTLVAHYGGNALALLIAGETIRGIFGGEIAPFLATGPGIFGDIRRLLDRQIDPLSPLERVILTWLAIEREPVDFVTLMADVGPGVPATDVVEAIESLQRHSFLERSARGTFTLQPVVLEYASDRLVREVAAEVTAGTSPLLCRYSLVRATAKDYVRRSQELLLALPLLERLRYADPRATAVQARLVALLEDWRGRDWFEQGYGPGNVVNLLRLLRGDLRGLNVAGLTIRQAYLQDVEAQDANFARATVTESVLGDAFQAIFTMTMSGDGKWIAAGTASGDVRVWRSADRAPHFSVRGHAGVIRGIAITQDARLVASGGDDGTLRLWDVYPDGHDGGGKLSREICCPPVRGVALSADGRRVAVCCVDGTVSVWDAATGDQIAQLVGHTGVVWGVALSADGQIVASGGDDRSVRVWDLGAGRTTVPSSTRPSPNQVFPAGPIRSVAISGDGRIVVGGASDGTVTAWDVGSGQSQVFPGHKGDVWGVGISAAGRLLASGGADGTVRLWGAQSGQALAVFESHASGIRAVAISGDGRLLASGGVNGTLHLWDAEGRRPLAALVGQVDEFWGVGMSADGRIVASGSSDRTVRLWDGKDGTPLAVLVGHDAVVLSAGVSADGRLVASGGGDGTIRLWDVASGRAIAVLGSRADEIWDVAFSGDGRILASGGADPRIQLWDVREPKLLAALAGHVGGVMCVALNQDGRILVSGGLAGTVRLWDTQSRQQIAVLGSHVGEVWRVALNANGRLAASSGQDGTLRLWDVEKRQLLAALEGHRGGARGLAMSGDGRLVATGGMDTLVRLWNVEERKVVAVLEGHVAGIFALALGQNGRLLASGSLDGTIKLWDTTSFALLRTLRPDRRFERMDITGLSGVTAAQRGVLLALGAVER
jgi:WD40 repeat protein/transcriptional regulator with XRE-family HTH domain